MSIVLTAAASAATEMQLLLVLPEFQSFKFCLGGYQGFVSQIFRTA
jgi:hypothetical protein